MPVKIDSVGSFPQLLGCLLTHPLNAENVCPSTERMGPSEAEHAVWLHLATRRIVRSVVPEPNAQRVLLELALPAPRPALLDLGSDQLESKLASPAVEHFGLFRSLDGNPMGNVRGHRRLFRRPPLGAVHPPLSGLCAATVVARQNCGGRGVPTEQLEKLVAV